VGPALVCNEQNAVVGTPDAISDYNPDPWDDTTVPGVITWEMNLYDVPVGGELADNLTSMEATEVAACTDVDADGYFLEGQVCGTEADCDDTDATVYPGATEILDDGIDQDCDGEDATTPPPCFISGLN